MENTYKSLRNLSTLYKGSTDYKTAAEDYQRTKDPVILAFVYCDLKSLIGSIANKYFYLAEDEKASLCLTQTEKAMLNYDRERGVKFQTVLTTYINRAFVALTEYNNNQIRVANQNADSMESVIELSKEEGDKEYQYDNIEAYDIIRSSNLTDNERKYCKIVMSEPNVLRDSEVAKLIGISPAAIHYMKQALARKLKADFLPAMA